MNTTLYNQLLNHIPSIEKTLDKINHTLSDNVLKYLKTDLGIFVSLEYLKDQLIPLDFKKDFKYFLKELNMLIDETKDFEKDVSSFLLWNNYDDYDQEIFDEKLILEFNKEYISHLKFINNILTFDIVGNKAKLFLKDYYKYHNTEDLFLINNQPQNTCPLIDYSIQNGSIFEELLEVLRTECEDLRSEINEWKDSLWNNAILRFSPKEVSLKFKECPQLNIDLKNFNDLKIEESSAKAVDNYNKIFQWGIRYHKNIIENNLYFTQF